MFRVTAGEWKSVKKLLFGETNSNKTLKSLAAVERTFPYPGFGGNCGGLAARRIRGRTTLCIGPFFR
jgi:hypothetical protein